MSELADRAKQIIASYNDKRQIIAALADEAKSAGYTVVDIDQERPWGGFIRFDYADADQFVGEFFPNLNPVEARLGNPNAELSPKFLIVSPRQRLSWQRHDRRAERWIFLTEGGYYKSTNPDNMGDLVVAKEGAEVQFKPGECHRLVSASDSYVIAAEIWQHTDSNNPSDESDITRLQDDYKR